ncbi:MAG: M56 family metallopeptidase [Janthinobacterium lividum]
MEITPFILALSKTLPESCLQGLVVYLILQFIFLVNKGSTPLLKFNLYYVTNLCLFAGFIITFFHHYQQVLNASFSKELLQPTIKNEIQINIVKPTLWLQFNFWINHYAYLITGFYLLGLCFCMLKLTIGIINISWFRNNKNLKLDTYLSNISNQLSSNFRLIKTVSVFVSNKICVPLTLGFIKPIIVFPIALINQLSAEQTEAILLHELAHIKRNDYLLNLLLCIVQSFLFFNPAIWLMKHEINKYREQCCDDLVLDNTSHTLAYARALLLIEESRSAQLTLALASNGKKYNLLNRIKRITNMKTNEPSPQNKLVVLLLALITIGVCAAWNMPVKKVLKNHILRHVKITETKSNGITSLISAEKMEMQKYSKKNQLKLYTNKINFQPNNKSKVNFTFWGNRIAFVPGADTVIQSKNKFKIVLEDSLGNKKEYNSIDELPVADRKEFLKENKKAVHVENWNNFQLMNDTSKFAFNNKDLNVSGLKGNTLELLEQMRKKFDTPEWRKSFENLNKQGLEIQEQMRKKFDTPEWRKQQKKIKKEIEKSQKEWRKSYDQQLKPALLEKTITPQF